jgi:hypothetical protein
MSITKVHARQVRRCSLLFLTCYECVCSTTSQIFDSRGNPTVEVDLYTEKGAYALLEIYP